MSWVTVGVGVGTAALGAYQQSEQQKQQAKVNQANMLANAAAMEYSPWTGLGKERVDAKAGGTGADVLGAGLQSGLQGYMFGSQFGKKKAPNTIIDAGISPTRTKGLTQGFDPSSIA